MKTKVKSTSKKLSVSEVKERIQDPNVSLRIVPFIDLFITFWFQG